MMRKPVAIALICFLAVCSAEARKSGSELDWKVVRKGADVSIKVPGAGRHLGQRATIQYVHRPQKISVRTAADRAGPAYVAVVEGVQYTLMIPDDIEPRIEYIATDSFAFVTPEGLKVGSTHDELMAHALGEVVEEPEWGFFVCLASGWSAVFACNEGRWGLVGPENIVYKRTGGLRYCENEGLEHRVVGWFFKRRGTCGN